ncbi:MAG: hypothetical protein MZU79_03630 [Anaerotruncus sp.]|nr:hypothetical protein [Anaerotruncus sp.]
MRVNDTRHDNQSRAVDDGSVGRNVASGNFFDAVVADEQVAVEAFLPRAVNDETVFQKDVIAAR